VEGEDSYHFDIEAMLKIYDAHKPKVVLISSPNNPTGNRLEIDELKRLLHRMRDAVVVLDEAYAIFYNKDTSYLKEILDEFPNVLIIRTFSKYYGLAGIRIGYVLMGEQESNFKLFSSRYLGYNRLSDKIAIAALDSAKYYDDISRKMAVDMEIYRKEFNKLPGFKAYKSYANFILVKIPFEIKDDLKKYLEKRHIIIKFMAEEGLFNHLRISLGTQEQNKLLLSLIKTFVAEQVEHELVH
jgi:histidinol-phosphate aminotransferase